jgi:CheY-like chemotaxis protein
VQELSESIENTTPEQKEAKEIIDQNRRRLLSTMNSVIEYSRMEQEDLKVEIKDISITEIVDETQEEISDILKNKGIDFAYGKISSSLNFKTDPPKFVSLITLLFKIASQFSSTKKIYFSAYQIDDKNFLISIQDNYSSMSPSFSENFNNIFNSREIQIDYGFSKLSIKLARNLIALLQGKFIEKSKKQSGFVFPVELHPLEPRESQVEEKDAEVIKEPENSDKASTKKKTAETNEEVPESGEEEFQKSEFEETQFTEKEPTEESGFVQRSSLNRKRTRDYESGREAVNKSRIDLSQLSCLYIEDQVDSQILFKVQLKGVNEIKFAVSFEEALPLLDSHHFDFIVLDINLQGEYNGLDALKIIHRMPGYETIPIIAVTAYVLPGDREKFIAAGFNDFISKPIFREKMMDALEKIFSLMQS